MDQLIRRVEGASPSQILAWGALAVLLPVVGMVWAVGAGDLVLVGISGLSALATAWAWRTSRRLGELPLELAPQVGTGVVDGVVVYRFRARLGRGRTQRILACQVRWLPANGAPVELPVQRRTDHVCGPYTILVYDPTGLCGAAGQLEVQLTVRSAGRRWSACRRYERADIARGRFRGGIVVRSGHLDWTGDWDVVSAD